MKNKIFGIRYVLLPLLMSFIILLSGCSLVNIPSPEGQWHCDKPNITVDFMEVNAVPTGEGKAIWHSEKGNLTLTVCAQEYGVMTMDLIGPDERTQRLYNAFVGRYEYVDENTFIFHPKHQDDMVFTRV